MGFRSTEDELKDLLLEIDEDGSGEIEFGEFCQLCATFLVEDPDMETMRGSSRTPSGCTTRRDSATSPPTHSEASSPNCWPLSPTRSSRESWRSWMRMAPARWTSTSSVR